MTVTRAPNTQSGLAKASKSLGPFAVRPEADRIRTYPEFYHGSLQDQSAHAHRPYQPDGQAVKRIVDEVFQ